MEKTLFSKARELDGLIEKHREYLELLNQRLVNVEKYSFMGATYHSGKGDIPLPFDKDTAISIFEKQIRIQENLIRKYELEFSRL